MTETDVIIIGAGPTGLSLACQLVRYGINFVIVEKNEAVTPYSKAIGVQARTLEIYEQIGLARKAIQKGSITGKVRLLAGGEVRGEMDLSHIGEGLSAYPFVLMLEQSKNEQLLYEYLQSQGKEVRWQTELESFSQSESGVTAQVKTAGSGSQTIRAKYLVGCDGAKSPTRRALGLKFEGSTFERMFYVADAQVDWDFSHDALHACLSKDSFVLFFPLKGETRYRIVGVFQEEFARDEGDILYEEIEGHVKQETKLDLDIHDVEWFSTYKVHTRHVAKFSAGRCFLAGDSAHIHSPAGAQGMNTGIQDGYNLAWKMALVSKGITSEELLATYNEERLENAKRLLQTTDRMFQFVAGSDWFLDFLRTNILPSVAGFLLSFDTVKNLIFPLVSQIGINYRHSSLSRHAGDEDFKVKAGDRLPYFLVEGKSVYELLQRPRFHWLVFSRPSNETSAAELEDHGSGIWDLNNILLSPQVEDAFGTDKPFNLLLRPDNYIGFISTETSLERLREYFDEGVGLLK